jgi:hypothetical protein
MPCAGLDAHARAVVISGVGDSLTYGASAENSQQSSDPATDVSNQGGWRKYLLAMLQERYQGKAVLAGPVFAGDDSMHGNRGEFERAPLPTLPLIRPLTPLLTSPLTLTHAYTLQDADATQVLQ